MSRVSDSSTKFDFSLGMETPVGISTSVPHDPSPACFLTEIALLGMGSSRQKKKRASLVTAVIRLQSKITGILRP